MRHGESGAVRRHVDRKYADLQPYEKSIAAITDYRAILRDETPLTFTL